MAWKKSSPSAVRRFDELVPVEGAERRILFGCPIYVLGEARYATLFGDRFVLRLSSEDAAELISEGGVPFEPHQGRPSKERVVVPAKLAANTRVLKAWLRKAVAFARRKAKTDRPPNGDG